jgi:hypothetical protein
VQARPRDLARGLGIHLKVIVGATVVVAVGIGQVGADE